jgi:hypothetical protein
MKHLTEEQLIEHYYSEGVEKSHIQSHLQVCKHCAQACEELGALLGSIRAPETRARGSEYGEHVWRSIQGTLLPFQPERKRAYFSLPRFAYAVVCLLFLAGAFSAGRIWEKGHTKPILAGNSQQTKERVVLFVLDNHLDRSERLLVQLNHASPGAGPGDLPLQMEARELLTDNRLYRQSLNQKNDPALAAALDHLERVLLEVANSPEELSPADMEKIETEMNTRGLLFQIRVLRARVTGEQTKSNDVRKGRTIS